MKAIICGSGIAGLTLAWFLERDGWEVLIVERAPGPRGEGYLIDFFASGLRRRRADGLLPRLRALYSHVARDQARPADPRAVLRSEYAPLGWVIPRALAHCPEPPDLYYDQVAQIEMPTWRRGRVTLVGDACPAVSLLAGQGAAMAMGGAYTLADELRRGSDVGTALARYEARVKPAVERKQAAGRRTAAWLVPDSQWRIAVRNQVLRLATLPGLSGLLRPVLTTPAGSIVPRQPSE